MIKPKGIQQNPKKTDNANHSKLARPILSIPNANGAFQYQKIKSKNHPQVQTTASISWIWIPSDKFITLTPIQLTKAHFIDAYSKVRLPKLI